MNRPSLYAALAAACLLAACAAGPFGAPQPGDTRDAVVARFGKPTRTVPIPGGERLQYSQQPRGPYAWMIDFDAAGRVTQARQVLNPQDFNRIQPGWTRADVEREFGPPALVDRVSSWTGDIYTYRWLENNNPMFFWVYFDPRGIVGRAHPGIEYINAPNGRD